MKCRENLLAKEKGMQKNIKRLLTASWLAVVCLALIGCATGGSGTTLSQVPISQTPEQLLSAAGFKQVIPTTPRQKARLSNMPQKQIFIISKGVKTYYIYADAQDGCLYVGKEKNYDKFQDLLAQAQMASEQYAVAQMNSWDWNGWGPATWGVGEAGAPF
jgi:hypothetical protein